MAATSEDEALPLRLLKSTKRVPNQSDDAEAEEAPLEIPFVRQESQVPMVEGIVHANLYTNIMWMTHYVLDKVPMPVAARNYLMIRWLRLFVSVISVLVIAVVTAIIVPLVVNQLPSVISDPFSNWGIDLGPIDRTTYRLTDYILPRKYRLHFFFHMDGTPQQFRYEGRVAIDVEISSPGALTKRFLIHAHKDLDIDYDNFLFLDNTPFIEEMANDWESFPYVDVEGSLKPGSYKISETVPEKHQTFGPFEVPKVTRLDDYTLRVQVSRPLVLHRAASVILIRFKGTVRENPPGIFVNKINNSDDYWLGTNFQPSLARIAFPCFDEPSFRSAFHVSVAHPRKYAALSNMAGKATHPTSLVLNGYSDYIWSTFKPSIVMPPHLFGFVIGPFKSKKVQGREKHVPEIQMFALNQDDLLHRSNYAANVTVQAMTFARDYFDIDYLLPKLQLVVLPSKHPIDSECWGLIIYREDNIFLNETTTWTTTAVESLENVARHVCHYIIHQWVGNLVGPVWWDELWATEVLIAYLENVFLEKIFPEWHVWENFATLVIGEALRTDCRSGTHPVSALPRIPYYPTAVFDTLTSHKGAAILRMMELHSPGCIQTAVRNYLVANAGGSVSADTFFEQLHLAINPLNTTSKDDPPPPLVEVVKKWTHETRYPLVSVLRYSSLTHTALFQEMFYPKMTSEQSLETQKILERKCQSGSRYERVPGSTVAWSVPLDFVSVNKNEIRQVDKFWQTTTYQRVCGVLPNRSTIIIANYNQTGFYRVDYDSGNWQLIGHEMMHTPHYLSPITRAMLIDDAMTMAKIGRLYFVEALELPLALLHQGTVKKLNAADVGMYERAMRAVADVHDCLRGSKHENKMLEYMRLLAGAQWDLVNPPECRKLERANGRNHTDILSMRTSIMLQEQAIFWACYTGMTECTDWSVEIVRRWQESYQSEHEDWIEEHYSNAYCAAVRFGPDTNFDFLWKLYHTASLSDKHKKDILWALLCTPHLDKFLDIIGIVPGNYYLVQYAIKHWKKMDQKRVSAWYAFKYERPHRDIIHRKMFESAFYNRMLVAITSALSEPTNMEDIEELRKKHKDSLWDVQDLLKENVANIRNRLYFRGIIEQSLPEGLQEILQIAEAVKLQADGIRAQTPAPPLQAYTRAGHDAATPHPAS